VQECTFFHERFPLHARPDRDCAENFRPEIDGLPPVIILRQIVERFSIAPNLRVVIPSESLALSGVEWVEGSLATDFPIPLLD
jgi:hypothetical protein